MGTKIIGGKILGKSVFGPNVISENLIFHMDVANTKSYPKSGDSATDLSGYQYDINLVGGTSYDSENLGSFSYDGQDDYVLVTGNTYTFVSGYTYETYFYWDGAVINGYAGLYVGDGSKRTLIDSSGKYLTQTNNGDFYSTNSPVIPHQWSHFSYTIDFQNEMEYMYHNGELVGSQPRVISYDFPIEDWKIGWGSINSTYYVFSGKISTCKIYDRYFSSSEVYQNYNGLRSRYGYVIPPSPQLTQTPTPTPTTTPTPTPTITPTPTQSCAGSFTRYQIFIPDNVVFDPYSACANGSSGQSYDVYQYTTDSLQVDDYLYSDACLTTEFNHGLTNNNWFFIEEDGGGNEWAIRVDVGLFAGAISEVIVCGTITPTPTPTPSITVTPSITPSITPSASCASVTTFQMDTNTTYSNAWEACNATSPDEFNVWLDTFVPEVDATIYTDSCGVNEWTSRPGTNDSWFWITEDGGGSEYAIRVDSIGLIIEVQSCVSVSPTPSPSQDVSPTPTPTVTPTITPTVTPTITPTPTPSPSPQVISVGEACWALNEDSGTLYDGTGDNNLTTYNNLTFNVPGKISGGSAVGFFGTNSYAYGLNNTLKNITDVSVSFWFRTSTPTSETYRTVITTFGTEDGGFKITILPGGAVGMHIISMTHQGIVVVSSYAYTWDTNWHHVVVTQKSSTRTNIFYIDGVFNRSVTNSYPVIPVTGANSVVSLGKYPITSYGSELNGDLDQVNVWDYVLTQDNVTYLYNNGDGRGCETYYFCYTGRYPTNDPLHPDGGEIVYVDVNGAQQTESFIYADAGCQCLLVKDVILTTGITSEEASICE